MEVVSLTNVEFSGNCLHTIDPKGRVTVPAAYREILSQGFTIGLNNEFQAIAIYPRDKWTEKCEQMDRIPESDIKGTAYVRLIMGNSFPDSELDGQGRVLLPLTLRQKTGMSKNIRFVGMGRYLEIWDDEKYTASCSKGEASIEELLNYVNEKYYTDK